MCKIKKRSYSPGRFNSIYEIGLALLFKYYGNQMLYPAHSWPTPIKIKFVM